MTGYPQFNFPLFHMASAKLRAAGFAIISPAEMDSPAVQTAAIASADGKLDAQGKIAGETWGEILARDVRIVADQVQGLIFLPKWFDSKGAKLEAFTALLCGHKFGIYTDNNPLVVWMPAHEVFANVSRCMKL
jgi:hypothetical protein